MFDRTTIISSTLLPGILLFSWLVFQWTAAPKTLPSKVDQPDGFMVNMVATRMTTAGKPQDQVIAPLVVHYPVNDTADINMPHFISFPDAGSPWHVYANKGQMRNQANILELWGNVRIERARSLQNSFIKMTTDRLTIYPKDEYAETKLPITVMQDSNVLHAVGMRANLKTDTVDLLSQTKAHYEKAPAK